MAKKSKIREEEDLDIKLSPEEETQLDNVLDHISDDGEELSENFRRKFKAIFEATINRKVRQIREELENQAEEDAEELETKVERIAEESASEIEDEIEKLKDELEENLDRYLSYVVENWMSDNRVAIETGHKVKVAESIMSGLKKLVEENDIEIEEEDEDKFLELEEKIKSLSKNYDKLFERYTYERESKENLYKKVAVQSVISEMTLTDADKFKALAEDISYSDVKDYVQKLETIKESYFPERTPGPRGDFTEMLQEDIKNPTAKTNDPNMEAYLASLDRMK